MSACPTIGLEGSNGIASALRAVDCASIEATEVAFGRLFGPNGGLGSALTVLLTIYIAVLAINLLTGRSRIGLNMLTPRMLTLGLVLTFATSWVAYQSVVWALLTAGPDQIASVIMGESGSATAAFAQELDALFAAVSEAAQAAANAPPAPMTEMGITPAAPQAAGWTPDDVLWLAALLLLLGTVGVLLVARIALAVLLAVGPVFIVLALFHGSHGLFVGWLKGAVMFALVPLFTVLVGGAALALLGPVVAQLSVVPTAMQPAVTMFLGAAVYVALMVMVMKVSTAMVAGWHIPGGRESTERDSAPQSRVAPLAAVAGSSATHSQVMAIAPLRESNPGSDRVRAIVSGAQRPANDVGVPSAADRRATSLAAANERYNSNGSVLVSGAQDRRAKGIGEAFRATPAASYRKPQS